MASGWRLTKGSTLLCRISQIEQMQGFVAFFSANCPEGLCGVVGVSQRGPMIFWEGLSPEAFSLLMTAPICPGHELRGIPVLLRPRTSVQILRGHTWEKRLNKVEGSTTAIVDAIGSSLARRFATW